MKNFLVLTLTLLTTYSSFGSVKKILDCKISDVRKLVVFSEGIDRSTLLEQYSISFYEKNENDYNEVERFSPCSGKYSSSIYRGSNPASLTSAGGQFNCEAEVKATYSFSVASGCRGGAGSGNGGCAYPGKNQFKGSFNGEEILVACRPY
jgi:hypothetical protein